MTKSSGGGRSRAAKKGRGARGPAAIARDKASAKARRIRNEAADERRGLAAARSAAGKAGSRAAAPKPAAAPRKKSPAAAERPPGAPAAPSVEDLLRGHPLRADLDAARRMILGAGPDIRELVKWNAPSFRTHEDFATLNLRSTAGVQVVLHLGVKTKPGARTPEIPDPRGLVTWLAPDRCLVTLGSGPQLAANREAFQAIVRAWIAQLPVTAGTGAAGPSPS